MHVNIEMFVNLKQILHDQVNVYVETGARSAYLFSVEWYNNHPHPAQPLHRGQLGHGRGQRKSDPSKAKHLS